MITLAQDLEKDVDSFVNALAAAEQGTPAYHRLYLLFGEELHKAVNEGRICTKERMLLLYPILREIDIETEENAAFWKAFENKARIRKTVSVSQKKPLAIPAQ